jgi:hypothetical protein
MTNFPTLNFGKKAIEAGGRRFAAKSRGKTIRTKPYCRLSATAFVLRAAFAPDLRRVLPRSERSMARDSAKGNFTLYFKLVPRRASHQQQPGRFGKT